MYKHGLLLTLMDLFLLGSVSVRLAMGEGLRIWQSCLPASLKCFEAAPVFDQKLCPLLAGAERRNEAIHNRGEGLAGTRSFPKEP